MVDHVDQVPLLATLTSKSGGNPPLVFLKVNVGSNRAGVIPDTPACSALVDSLLASEAAGESALLGLYCHAGHSYATRQDWEAMGILGAEFEALRKVAELVRDRRAPGKEPLVLSVGATPTATTIQHPDLATAKETNGTNGTNGANGTNGHTNGNGTHTNGHDATTTPTS